MCSCAGEDFNADTAIVPLDSLSRQALEAQAKDMAIEDALYALDKALQHGTITSELYLKQVSIPTPSAYMVNSHLFLLLHHPSCGRRGGGGGGGPTTGHTTVHACP